MKIETINDASCINCSAEGSISRVSQTRQIIVTNGPKTLTVDVLYAVRKCEACKIEFRNTRDHDFIAQARDEAVKAGFINPGERPSLKFADDEGLDT